MDFSMVSSVAQTRPDINIPFFDSLKGVRMKCFLSKVAFKIFTFDFCLICLIRHFLPNFRKFCFIIFIYVWPL